MEPSIELSTFNVRLNQRVRSFGDAALLPVLTGGRRTRRLRGVIVDLRLLPHRHASLDALVEGIEIATLQDLLAVGSGSLVGFVLGLIVVAVRSWPCRCWSMWWA